MSSHSNDVTIHGYPPIDQNDSGPSACDDMYQCCPVCGGRCSVPHDFYTQFGCGTSTAREQCRSCLGRGYIRRPSTDALYGSVPGVRP